MNVFTFTPCVPIVLQGVTVLKIGTHDVTIIKLALIRHITEETIITNEDLQNTLINRIEVLDKVKGLLLLPQLEMATTKQVAEFYEVDSSAIRKIIQRHRVELDLDGLTRMKGKDIIKEIDTRDNLSHLSIIREKGGFLVGEDTKVSYSGDTLFPRRAILRVGMLLRDSAVAKEVRTQLLNIEYYFSTINKQRITEKPRSYTSKGIGSG